MVMGRSKVAWAGLSLDQNCGGHQGGVKGIDNEYQLMERFDGHGGGVRGCGKVKQLTESVTVIRVIRFEMYKTGMSVDRQM